MTRKELMMKKLNLSESDFEPQTVTIDDLIESAAMQELRICCLELGIDANDYFEEDM